LVCVPEVIRNPFDFAQGSAAIEAATQSQTTSAGFHTNEISGYAESNLGGAGAGRDVEQRRIQRPITYAQTSVSPVAISVVMIASSFWRSRMIPRMPNTKAAGKENIISNAPSVARGLPQPGLQSTAITNVAPAMISRVAEILPKRICFPMRLSGPSVFISAYYHRTLKAIGK
jgi:hypothetical protein